MLLAALVALVLGRAAVQGQGINNRSLFAETITLGSADGTCGAKTECDVYLPVAQQLGEETLLPFFKTAFGRLLLRYVVRCCQFQHPLLSGLDPALSSIIPTEEECGFSAPEAALDIQKPGAWPWLAVLGRNSSGRFQRVCGGTLITRRHILTAAICFLGDFTLIARLGDFHLGQDEANATHLEFQVEKTVSLNYDRQTKQNDIAILTLPQDVTFTDYIRPACLPLDLWDDSFTGQDLVVVGYGDTSFGGEPSQVPLAAALTVTDLAKCTTVYQNLDSRVVVNESQLCLREENQGPCQGDSGSPLNYFNPATRRYYIVGIVSFGYGCGHPEYPGVYTRVGAYLNWIIANL